jgi:hypothetical protein
VATVVSEARRKKVRKDMAKRKAHEALENEIPKVDN